MTPLTSDQLAEIRAELSDARLALLRQVDNLTADDATLVSARASAEERAKSSGDADLLGVERNLVARASSTIRQGLEDIDAALKRLDDGTYGVCTKCGGQIPPERLMVRPRAATCVPCASTS